MQTRTRFLWAGTLSLLVVGAIGLPPLLGQTRPIKQQIRAISKLVEGTYSTANDRLDTCPDGRQVHTFDARIEAAAVSFDCDEPPSNPEWNVRFLASARIIRREAPEANHRGCFEGRWRFVDAAGKTLASGPWRGTVECGTHNGIEPVLDCEPCSAPRHFEGTLDGTAPRVNLPGGPARICATVQGFGLTPNEQPGAPGPFRMRIEGAVFLRCSRQTGM
jgi:hypothetical protein